MPLLLTKSAPGGFVDRLMVLDDRNYEKIKTGNPCIVDMHELGPRSSQYPTRLFAVTYANDEDQATIVRLMRAGHVAEAWEVATQGFEPVPKSEYTPAIEVPAGKRGVSS